MNIIPLRQQQQRRQHRPQRTQIILTTRAIMRATTAIVIVRVEHLAIFEKLVFCDNFKNIKTLTEYIEPKNSPD